MPPTHHTTTSPPAARHYHPTLSIWLSVDPMSDKYPSTSPYTYCGNNPVRLVDPEGRDWGDYFDYQGKYLGTDGIDDGKIYIVTQQDWNQFADIENGMKMMSDFATRPSSANLSDDAIINILAKYNTTGKTCTIQEEQGSFLATRITKIGVRVTANVSAWKNNFFLDNHYDIMTLFDNESGHLAHYDEIGWDALNNIYSLGERGKARCEKYAIAWQLLYRHNNFARSTKECQQHIIDYLNISNEKDKFVPIKK